MVPRPRGLVEACRSHKGQGGRRPTAREVYRTWWRVRRLVAHLRTAELNLGLLEWARDATRKMRDDPEFVSETRPLTHTQALRDLLGMQLRDDPAREVEKAAAIAIFVMIFRQRIETNP